MGGRKKSSRKPVVRKPPPPLDKEFACPFCNNERVVICKLDKKARKGTVRCKVCDSKGQDGSSKGDVGWTAPINDLTAEVDLYNDWIEACLAANRKAEKERAERRKLQAAAAPAAGSAGPRAPVRAGMAAAPVRTTGGGIALKAIRRPRENDDDLDLPEMPASVSGGRIKRTAMDYAGVGSDDDDAGDDDDD